MKQNVTPSVSEMIIRVPVILRRVPLVSRRYLGRDDILQGLHTHIGLEVLIF